MTASWCHDYIKMFDGLRAIVVITNIKYMTYVFLPCARLEGKSRGIAWRLLVI